MKKTKTIFSLSLLLIIMIAKVHAQSNNNSKIRRLNNSYHAVMVSSGIILNVVNGDSKEALVKASNADYLDKIKTIVENDTLKVFFYYKDDPNWKGLVNSTETFSVIIHEPNLNFIQASEGSNVNCQIPITTELLKLKLLTGGQLKGITNCKSISVHMQGGSKLKLAGEVANAEYVILGGSEADAKNLKTTNCKADVHSASSLNLYVTQNLDVIGKNKAKIYFSGNPLIIKKDLEDSFLRHNFL
jgi:hypothetical protein